MPASRSNCCLTRLFWFGAPDSIGFRGSSSSSSHGGGHEQVVKPVGVIPQAVQVVAGRAARPIVAATAGPVRMEVPRQDHGTHGQAGACRCAVPGAHCLEPPVLMVHEPIEGSGGPMRCREAVRWHERWALAAAREDRLPDCPLGQARRRPLAQTAQPLRELGPREGFIDLPDPVQDERAQRKVAPTALGDF
jgi:hypothetical protein